MMIIQIITDLEKKKVIGPKSSKAQKSGDKVYYHSQTYLPIRPDEPIVDSEDEADLDWFYQKTESVTLPLFWGKKERKKGGKKKRL